MSGLYTAIVLFILLQALILNVANSSDEYRLPPHVRPLNYKLSLEPDISTNVVRGSLLATITVGRSLNAVSLNAENIRIIGSPSLSGNRASSVTYNPKTQTVTISFNETILPGIWQLRLNFESRVSTALSGIYRVTSATATGDGSGPETYVMTHFEPTDARKAFPCWDEPALKATFDISIVAPAGQTVLSNTPMVSRTPLKSRPHLTEAQFARTPLMSTYLMAFAIGRFDFLETMDSNGVQIRVYTPVGRKHEGAFALDIANRTLPYYAKLFGSSYPLPKMDLVSMPDFPSIAMENWGLVMFNEPYVLVSRDTPWSARVFNAVTILHELAHQWFGNLVSPKWWSDLWLNEGFATWVSFFTAEHIVKIDVWSEFIKGEKILSMSYDAMQASHPIEAKIKQPRDVAEVFDSISYGKGASVVSMLHDWLGHELFFKGLRLYLTRYRYANAATDDLWLAMQVASGEPVVDVMRDWTERKGFPMIGATIEKDKEQGTCVLRLEQRRYSLPGAKNFHRLWRVPVTVATEDGGTIRRVMTGSRLNLTLPTCGWAMLNPNAAGYYRTAYQDSLMENLVLEAGLGKESRIQAVGRLTLIDDAFAMHAADMALAEEPLWALEHLKRDSSLQVWQTMLGHLYSLGGAIQVKDRRSYANWLRYLQRLCSEKLDEFGWDSDPSDAPDAGAWRSLLVNCLNYADVGEVARWAADLFPSWVDDKRPDKVSADLWVMVCQIHISNGGDGLAAKFTQVLRALRRAASVERRLQVIECLCSFSGKGIEGVERQLMELALGSELKSTEAMILIIGLSRRTLWSLITNNWDKLARRFQGPFMIKHIVAALDFSSADRVRCIERFFQNHTAIGLRDAVRQLLEQATVKAERINKDRVELRFLVNSVLASGDWS